MRPTPTFIVVLNTLLEHNSNDLPWRNIPRLSLVRIQADDDGFINTNELETIMRNYNQKEKHGKKRVRLFAISYGCHCAHILIKHMVGAGPFLERFQKIIAKFFPGVNFPGLARISLGLGNNEEDIERLIRVIDRIAGKVYSCPWQ